MGVSPEEKIAFLKRQGWREDLPQDRKDSILAMWSDADIEMAIALNLA